MARRHIPAKDRALAAGQARYDQWLIVAAHMLEVHVPDAVPTPGCPIPPEDRGLLEDRLAQAGLDAFAHRPRPHYDAVGDDDPFF